MAQMLTFFWRARSNSDEREHKVNALIRARTIWSKIAHHSKEAAHASDILESILSKIYHPEENLPSARRSPTDDEEHLDTSVPANASGSGNPRDDRPSSMRTSERTPLQSSWSAVNAGTAPEKAPNKSYSIEWSFDWLDDLGKRKDHTLHGALENVLTDGVDWVSDCSPFLVLPSQLRRR